MAFQFLHIETYARSASSRGKKASARSIANESERVPGSCPHVDSPGEPIRVLGCSPHEAVDLAEQRAADARDARGRKLRKDAQVLAGIVASFPAKSADLQAGADDPELSAWVEKTLAWAREEWGDNLVSGVLHLDESHPHLHLYAVPSLQSSLQMTARDVHPGIAARDAIPAAKGNNSKRQRAFKDAMRDMQDRYHSSVSQHFGHARLGPQKRRLSRAEWKAEQATSQQLADQLAQAEKADASIRSRIAAHRRREEKLNNQADVLVKRLARLKRREKTVQQQGESLDRLGGRLGRLWASFSRVPARIESQVLGDYEKRSEAILERLAAIESERDTVTEKLQEMKQANARLKDQVATANARASRYYNGDFEAEKQRAMQAEHDAQMNKKQLKKLQDAIDSNDPERIASVRSSIQKDKLDLNSP